MCPPFAEPPTKMASSHFDKIQLKNCSQSQIGTNTLSSQRNTGKETWRVIGHGKRFDKAMDPHHWSVWQSYWRERSWRPQNLNFQRSVKEISEIHWTNGSCVTVVREDPSQAILTRGLCFTIFFHSQWSKRSSCRLERLQMIFCALIILTPMATPWVIGTWCASKGETVNTFVMPWEALQSKVKIRKEEQKPSSWKNHWRCCGGNVYFSPWWRSHRRRACRTKICKISQKKDKRSQICNLATGTIETESNDWQPTLGSIRSSWCTRSRQCGIKCTCFNSLQSSNQRQTQQSPWHIVERDHLLWWWH